MKRINTNCVLKILERDPMLSFTLFVFYWIYTILNNLIIRVPEIYILDVLFTMEKKTKHVKVWKKSSKVHTEYASNQSLTQKVQLIHTVRCTPKNQK